MPLYLPSSASTSQQSAGVPSYLSDFAPTNAVYELCDGNLGRIGMAAVLPWNINQVYMNMFVAPADIETSGVSTLVTTGVTTLTYGEAGLYELGDTEPLTWTQIAVSDTGTSVWETSNAVAAQTWTTPVTLTAGKRYAVMWLFTGTRPTVATLNISLAAAYRLAPYVAGSNNLTRSSLPATLSNSSITAQRYRVFAWLT